MFPPAKLDLEYTSHRNLDIVVSHYSESLSDLLTSLSSIIAIPSIAALTPRITVYTKHPTIPLSEIATALSLPESSIKRLPNKGREGGTYLSHILGNWDDLAAHTLFLQAEVHNSFYLQRRLREFFDVKKTGYLPLGFSGKFCELTDCTDEWDWKDRYHHIPALYTLRYGVFAPPGKMSLSYKGQFVVSAKRVRGVGRDTMLYLRDVLEGGASPYSRKNPEVPDLPGMEGNAPSFGFVLERVWGMVFGCADGRMAVDCPSLWRARKKGEGDDTCQCLDRA